jgi:hypothetical protein
VSRPQRFSLIVLLGLMGSMVQAADKEAIKLFNGKNLDGWTWVAPRNPDSKIADVWSVTDEGVLVCKGQPPGYLRSTGEYENYKLTLEWRWPKGKKPGNNGVLVHTTTPGALGIWPRSIEVQLFHDNAGDLWVIGTTLEVPNADKRRKGRRHLNLTDDSEKPVGEWNKMEVTCKGDEITVKVNGDLVNHATKVGQTKGAICLQSEGAEINFRNIVLTPLK